MTIKCPICNNVFSEELASCPACGYRLLGSTQAFAPIKFNSRGDTSEPKRHRFDLRVVRGPQTGIDIDLKQGELLIGRDPRCDIFLNDMTVSRNHATIKVGQEGSIISDLNSVNGVWVNDRLVEVSELRPGDLLQIGAFCLIYRERP